MANITISDLRPAGADLFRDSESYMQDLAEGEILNTFGGGTWWVVTAVKYYTKIYPILLL